MKKQDRYFFPAIFSYVAPQEVQIRFPDLDVKPVSAVNDQSALEAARDSLGAALYELEISGAEIPPPTPLSNLSLAEGEQTCLVDVFMPAVRLAGENRAVTRTVTVPAWLNALALQQHLNFSQVLQEGLKIKLGLQNDNMR